MNATVQTIEYPRDDIGIITIKPDDDLSYKAGQYMTLSVSDFDARPYSIANKPGSDFAEIHVKNTGGQASQFILNDLKEGDRVHISGVDGQAFYDAGDVDPLIFIAGGLGITPVKAMIEEALHHDHEAPIRLYWGVRDDSDDYLAPYFRMLSDVVERFDMHIQTGGLIVDAVLTDFALLDAYKIYLAGSENMIKHTVPLLLERGADKDRILYDRYVVPSAAANQDGDK